MQLSEAAIRRRVIELLDGCNDTRLNLWLLTGTVSGTFGDIEVGKIMEEELPRRSHKVQRYWLGDCNCDGHLN